MKKNDIFPGQKINKWTVIEEAERAKNGKRQFLCQCECGTIKTVRAEFLRSGRSKSCGCLRKELQHEKAEDFSGRRYGILTVLERDWDKEVKDYSIYWKCKCDCGNEVSVRGFDLKSGKRTSCGCVGRAEASKRMKENNPARKLDITNQRFGKLIALRPTDKRSSDGHAILWECICDCGNICYKSAQDLKDGNIISCGCAKSKGEEKISLILQENNISFEREKTFPSCIYPKTNAKLRFDFYVENKYLIEYDGEQHFTYRKSESIRSNKEQLKDTQERDCFKNKWCKDNNIPLIRIPYTEYKNLCLNDLLIETTSFMVVDE